MSFLGDSSRAFAEKIVKEGRERQTVMETADKLEEFFDSQRGYTSWLDGGENGMVLSVSAPDGTEMTITVEVSR